jgi:hypothetical protein
MTGERFAALTTGYDGERANWPAAERITAAAFAQSAKGRAILKQAGSRVGGSLGLLMQSDLSSDPKDQDMRRFLLGAFARGKKQKMEALLERGDVHA